MYIKRYRETGEDGIVEREGREFQEGGKEAGMSEAEQMEYRKGNIAFCLLEVLLIVRRAVLGKGRRMRPDAPKEEAREKNWKSQRKAVL